MRVQDRSSIGQANHPVRAQPQRVNLGQELISVDTLMNHAIRMDLAQHDRPKLLPLTHADQVTWPELPHRCHQPNPYATGPALRQIPGVLL